MKELKPIINKEIYTETIQKKILEYWFEVIFKPLFDILEDFNVDVRYNAKATTFNLEKALYDGTLIYADEKFIGKFNAKISRELRALGAKFLLKEKTFRIELDKLPISVKLAIVKVNEDTKEIYRNIDATLNAIQENINSSGLLIDFGKSIDSVLEDLDQQFKGISLLESKDEKVKRILDTLSVKPDLTEYIKKEVATNYTNNMNLYIKNWNEEAIPELRKKVQEISFAGYRRDKIQELLQEQYGIAEKKAKFLAGQENRLLISQYRQQRFSEVGLKRYRWQTSGLMNVREDHRLLNGRIFTWDDPPIVDRATGRRGHPGEDYGCNCQAISIIE